MSGLVAALRRRHRLVREGEERGTSLIELIVGMGIMTVCGAIFLGSAVTLSRVTAKTQSVTDSASQTNLAYLKLERMVRYASAITPPGRDSSGNWYVEFRDTTSGEEVCTQLRLNKTTKQLSQRTWKTAITPVVATTFRQIATGFTNGDAAYDAAVAGSQPFFLEPNSTTTIYQQLTITLVSDAGTAGTSSSSRSSFRMTALNSTGSAPPAGVCDQVGRS